MTIASSTVTVVIRVHCSNSACGIPLKVSAALTGKKARCPKCKHRKAIESPKCCKLDWNQYLNGLSGNLTRFFDFLPLHFGSAG